MPTTSIPAQVWDQHLLASNGHLLQSWHWGEFKSKHDWTPVRIAVNDGEHQAQAQVLYRFQGPVSIGYVPRGPAFQGDVETLWPLLRKEIGIAARDHRAITTYLEFDRPVGLSGGFREAGLVVGPPHIQPGRTVKVPLGTDEQILKQMHQKTRYSVRLAGRRDVCVHQVEPTPENLDAFYTLMRDTSDRNEFGIHSLEYYRDFMEAFGESALLLDARVNSGEHAATLMAAKFGKEAIYMYGASSTEHRSNGAAFLLQFEAMRWARDNGCETYDLWGIPDEDPETLKDGGAPATKGDDWRGLYRFKTGFGGEIVSYPPMLERRHVPILPGVARRLNLVRG